MENEVIYLVPEPKNVHDSKALVILNQQSEVLGYVRKADNAYVPHSIGDS